MTDEKLAAIEAKLTVEAIGCDSPADVGVNEVRWLIAEVRRLQTPAMFGKTILDMIETHCNRDDLPNEDEADGALNAWLRMRAARDEAIADKAREYARGREDERAAVVAWLGRVDYWVLRNAIERGEHVEATDD